MNDFLKSLKEDLSDRRLLPLVAVAVVALVAAIGFVALGGGSSSSAPPPPTATPLAPGARGISVTQSAPSTAVAETTDGAKAQRNGSARNPFSLLPGTQVKVAVATASGSSSATSKASASTGSTGTGSTGGGSTTGTKTGSSTPKSSTPSTGSKPTTSTPTTTYSVAIEFGQLPPAGSGITPQLTSYPSLTKPTPLPSHASKLIEFLGVSGVGQSKGGSGKEATFALAGEAILHGNGICRPSPAQCSVITLKAGQLEQLEFFSSTGLLVPWELRVTNITTDTTTVTTTVTRRALRAQASNGRTALLASAGMRWSSQPGVIVTVHPRSRAHSAAHARH
jgi:hypothetical protein